MKLTLKQLCARDNVRASAVYGIRNPPSTEMEDEWKRTAHPWTVTIKRKRRQMTVPFYMGSALTHEPTAEEVLSCLVMDARSFMDTRCFGEWCSDFGYDDDSRKAERIYRQVEDITRRLHKFLGDDFGDYCAAEND